jgi:hypothetical protein
MNLRGFNINELGDTFPPALPETDRARWFAMTPKQRQKVTLRLAAITSWRDGAIGIDEAIEASGLSRSRFYTVAARWREAPSLASLGGFRGAGGARQKVDGNVINALQAVIADVYALNRGASVNRLVQLMVDASGIEGERLPGIQRRRAIVEAEMRRAEATGQAGHALRGDISAINLPREGGRPHLLYVLIDVGTRLILGAWTQADLDEVSGYRGAARDAQRRITSKLEDMQWTDRLMRIELKVQAQEIGYLFRKKHHDLGGAVLPQGSPKGYGKYFRELVGLRIGRIEITPARTEAGNAISDNRDPYPWSDEEARGAVALAVDQYNAEILGSLEQFGQRKLPPDDLAKALEILAI